jgi:phosphonate transport system permease protein
MNTPSSASSPKPTYLRHLLKRVLRPTLYIGGLIVLIIVYAVSIQATQIDFPRLIRDLPKGQKIVSDFLSPDLFSREAELRTIELVFPIPCGSAPLPDELTAGPRLLAEPNCASEREEFTLQGIELEPNSDVAVRWLFPDGRQLTAVRTQTDANGSFTVTTNARPLAVTVDGAASRLQVDTATPVGGIRPSQALLDVAQAMYVTIFMALLSIVIATIVSAPLSFLAAANVTRRGPLGTVVYYLTRSIFNVTRSYDPLVMATVFGFWLGFGPFAGALALTVVTIASLGKMFSEAVESIDPGPVEAITATGANRVQVILYGVVPQIIPDFLSFIIYHWDINVRISTIIGFVGGGGIGYYLSQRINAFEYSKAGTALLAIIIVVWALDFFSAEVRKELT